MTASPKFQIIEILAMAEVVNLIKFVTTVSRTPKIVQNLKIRQNYI